MDRFSNAFSALELDSADDRLEAPPPPPPLSSASVAENGNASSGLRSMNSNGSANGATKKKGKESGETEGMPLAEYKLPLVWIDLEMTGLNVEVDRILEIACIITDGSLAKSIEGPDLVIHQTGECLDAMGEWCQSHHAASGLTKKVLHSTVTEAEAEKQVMEFVKRNVGNYTLHLAGNSIYMDFLFLKFSQQLIAIYDGNFFSTRSVYFKRNNHFQKYMPNLASLFSHVLVDVSSIKTLYIRWYPRDQRKAPSKENKHRAMDDIRESIMELKFYRDNIFKSPKSRQ